MAGELGRIPAEGGLLAVCRPCWLMHNISRFMEDPDLSESERDVVTQNLEQTFLHLYTVSWRRELDRITATVAAATPPPPIHDPQVASTGGTESRTPAEPRIPDDI